MQDSVIAFQGALAGFEPLDLTPAERITALNEAERDLRKNHFNDIQNKRKKGEILYNAKRAAGHGEFTAWIEERQAAYFDSEGETGFYIGKDMRTPENYINLHLLYMNHTAIYEQYRHFPAWLTYRVASYVLNGKDPESVPEIQKIRAREAGLALEGGNGSEGGGTVTDCGLPPEYTALIEMCESGAISQLEAGRIVDRCTVDGTNERVIQVVQECGVLNTDCVVILENILESMTRAAKNGEPFNDVFEEARLTEGYITTADGDQVLLRQLSHREIWAAYVRSRHAANSGSGSGGGAKFKNMLNSEIEHAEALAIARDLNDEELIAQLEAEKTDQRFKLKLDKPV